MLHIPDVISSNWTRIRRFTLVFDATYLGIDVLFAWTPRERYSISSSSTWFLLAMRPNGVKMGE
jgi:hypothetical protein